MYVFSFTVILIKLNLLSLHALYMHR